MSDQSVFPEWRSFLGKSSDKETKGVLKSVVKRSGEIAPTDQKLKKLLAKQSLQLKKILMTNVQQRSLIL